MAKKEVIPENSVVAAVVGLAVAPTVKEVETQLGRELVVLIRVRAGSLVGPTVLLGSDEDPGVLPQLDGEVLLRFRSTFRADRLLFFAHAVLDRGVSPQTGFSGFSVRGDVVHGNERTVARIQGKTFLYQVWDWQDWR